MSSGSNRPLRNRPLFPRRSGIPVAAAALLLLGAVFATGCRDRKPAAGQSSADDSPPPPKGEPVVRVVLDDAVVARLTRAEVEKRPALADLMPPEARDLHSWKLIEARARAPEYEYLALPKPARNFPGQVPRIFVDRKGRVAFGMEKSGERTYFTTMRSGIEEVRVQTRNAGARAPAPGARADLSIVVGETAKTITAQSLDAIAKVPGADRDADGWYLRDVLALATPVAGIARVTLTAVDKKVEVDAAELTDDQSLAVIKINRMGRFRFKMWRLDGDGGRTLVKDGREITRIEVATKP